MKKSIWPSAVDGVIHAPPSKSAAQRAIAIASLCEGASLLHNPGSSDDVLAAIRVCHSLGADILHSDRSPVFQNNHLEEPGRTEYSLYDDRLYIRGGIKPPTEALHCGESGLCLRMFSGIAAALDFPVKLTGAKSLLNRPISIIEKGMAALGVECLSADGRLPLTIKGPVSVREANVDASGSSQLLTGVLIAAPLLKQDLMLTVDNLKSKPYTDLTLGIMRRFGVHVEHFDYQQFTIRAGQQYRPADYRVEGDWSGAAFLLVAGAIAGKVAVQNLDSESFQADKKIVDVLKQAGVTPEYLSDGTIVIKKRPLKSFVFDATDCPDLFPPLAVLAANCDGESRIIGTERLHSKESDRAATLMDTFTKLGIDIRVDGNTMCISGGRVKAVEVHSHGDHRIAMAAAVAALNADGPVNITGADAVSKSYPSFFDDLELLNCYPERSVAE
jgi:3-phosphoshikimate 1-carboxyvinyltransferase